jgi:hypothetical protein
MPFEAFHIDLDARSEIDAHRVIRNAVLRPHAAVFYPRDLRRGTDDALGEKEAGRKVSLREFLSWSIPFALLSSFVCFVLGMLIWVLPYVK